MTGEEKREAHEIRAEKGGESQDPSRPEISLSIRRPEKRREACRQILWEGAHMEALVGRVSIETEIC